MTKCLNTQLILVLLRVQFPSPATLSMTNITEQIQTADSNAEFIASQIEPPKPDGSNEGKKNAS